jgi:TetR/AcrR family transcriptional regulator, transcriptional repressor for nem operon
MPCLGIGSISEFGSEGEGTTDLNPIRDAAGSALRGALVAKVREAQAAGDLSVDLDANHGAGFLMANIASIRLAARSGASDAELRALARLSLQALK